MSRPKPRRAIRAIEADDRDLSALRDELEERLDHLRATVEAKRREGWTVVRCPRPAPDETP